MRKLDATGRLGFVGASEIYRGYQAGLFCVIKDLHADRLIFDSRPMNSLETAPGRWVYSSASGVNLIDGMPCMLGVIIDDLVALELLSKEVVLWSRSSQGASIVSDLVGRYPEVGLMPHPGKTFYEEVVTDIWGCHVNGDLGLVQASLKRALPLAGVLLQVVTMKTATVGLLEILVGGLTALFLFWRRLLSLLNVVYEPLQRGY